MLSEWETNTVLISDLLSQRHPEIVHFLRDILKLRGIPLISVSGMADIWIRDAAPIQINDRQFTQFRYSPSYLTTGYRHLITKPEVFSELREITTLTDSQLVIDGGNIVGNRSIAILTDKVVRENPASTRQEITNQLRQELGVHTVVLIPKEPYDVVGHADSMVRIVTDTDLVVSDYSEIDPRFALRLERLLQLTSFRITRLPYTPVFSRRDGIPVATGNYANFLCVGRLLIVPAYGLPQDEMTIETLGNLVPNAEIVSIPCARLADEGGVLNCISWTIYQAER